MLDTNLKKAIDIMGKKPINPIGSCFDSAYFTFIAQPKNINEGDRLCHGIGIANYPGQENKKIAHAWLEFDHNIRIAYDAIWGSHLVASVYRKTLKIERVEEYTYEEALTMGKKYDYPGPWDEEIVKICKDSTNG